MPTAAGSPALFLVSMTILSWPPAAEVSARVEYVKTTPNRRLQIALFTAIGHKLCVQKRQESFNLEWHIFWWRHERLQQTHRPKKISIPRISQWQSLTDIWASPHDSFFLKEIKISIWNRTQHHYILRRKNKAGLLSKNLNKQQNVNVKHPITGNYSINLQIKNK